METDSKKFVVGIGEALWDMLPDENRLGGAPMNFAYYAMREGLDALAISAVGDDELGYDLTTDLFFRKLKYHIDKVSFPTGTVRVTIDKHGEPSYDITKNVAWDNLPNTKELMEIAAKCQAVSFGTLAQRSECTRKTINDFLDAMPDNSIKLFDINLRQNFFTRNVVINSMKKCNILKMNWKEFFVMEKMFAYDGIIEGVNDDYRTEQEKALQMMKIELKDEFLAGCSWLMTNFDIPMVMLTCGAYGSYLFRKNPENKELGFDISFEETPHTSVVDTIGAGDAFSAGFLAAYMNGKSLKESHKAAIETANIACSYAGAIPYVYMG
ncbi:MAG: PfkB family carbohydrate kinase [Bacteroidales bacterium]|jgi:fructokinase|nr:PfkB family carbohydrate kinase [Bacteroidales bacterium]MCI2122242.1 PfkB family carbohydrate kinase [Bacteroidales bacterium]MCI2144802.1 PfkB family carbohydrate kinase [Bacteroidales bacterium]